MYRAQRGSEQWFRVLIGDTLGSTDRTDQGKHEFHVHHVFSRTGSHARKACRDVTGNHTFSNGTLVGHEIEPALDLKLRELFCIREPAMLSLIAFQNWAGGSFLLGRKSCVRSGEYAGEPERERPGACLRDSHREHHPEPVLKTHLGDGHRISEARVAHQL